MSELDGWYSIFRAGTHVDRAGVERTFTAADLDRMVEGYEPGSASNVITHDEMYSPFGFGRIDAVRREGDLLQARCAEPEPQFAALVGAGRLHNRSVQLLPRRDGGWRVAHVAWMGVEPPAVEGLAAVAMSAAAITFAVEGSWEDYRAGRRSARVLAALRRLAEKVFGDDPGAVDEIVSAWEVEDAMEEAGAARERAERQTTEETGMSQFSQEQLDAAVAAAVQQALAAREREFETERGQFAAERAAARLAKAGEVVAGHVAAGRLTPAQATGLPEFMASLDDAAEIEFSAAEGAAPEKRGSRAWLDAFLAGLPESRRDGASHFAASAAPSAGPGADAPADAADIQSRAREYQAAEFAKGRSVSIFEAVRAVSS